MDPATLLIIIGTLVIGVLIAHLLARQLFGSRSLRRHSVLLVGLPSSGKSALFSQLTAGTSTESRTSMEVNKGTLLVSSSARAEAAGPASGDACIVDYPGHRRLQANLFPHLAEARCVVVAVDSVTIHDDRHDGAVAVSELLLSVMQSPEFFGVQRVLVACTKRDELTSYSAKAVRKLLESAMAKAIVAKQGELGQVDTVVDAKGSVVTAKRRRRGVGGGKAYLIDVEEDGSFSFDQLGIAVDFAEVSSFPEEGEHRFNVQPVVDFIVGSC